MADRLAPIRPMPRENFELDIFRPAAGVAQIGIGE
jgi:hypothetical protein